MEPVTCTSADGTSIATYDLGGRGPDLLLVHATGFCAAVLEPLAAALAPTFHCTALDLRFHGRSGRSPDDHRWERFGEDVLAAVDRLGLDHPFGFGHSCGGASLLLAEVARPGTFAGLFCFEPVVFAGPPEPPISVGNPLAEGALRRRETFPSAAHAYANFASKPPFSTLDQAVLQRYVACGFEIVPVEEGGDGTSVRLRCRREDESAVYAHGRSHAAFVHLDRVACPVALACGAETDAFGIDALAADAGRLAHATVDVVPGLGHFGPLEAPAAVAGLVVERLLAPAVPTGPVPVTPTS
ncbi:MAG: alpha/beta hydrolase [Actinomycetota bacterium]|jgi:pimeloyl-ACP methyl ester carboxylesterase|nr:alpha/beta hydrolase [Actinomycetota bacterium]